MDYPLGRLVIWSVRLGMVRDHKERAMPSRIACDAAASYAELEREELREKVIALQGELKLAKGNMA